MQSAHTYLKCQGSEKVQWVLEVKMRSLSNICYYSFLAYTPSVPTPTKFAPYSLLVIATKFAPLLFLAMTHTHSLILIHTFYLYFHLIT